MNPTAPDGFARRRYDPRLQIIALLVGGLAATCFGWLMLGEQLEDRRLQLISFLLLVVGPLCTLSTVNQFRVHSRLILDADGFTISRLFKSQRFQWRDLTAVRVEEASLVNKLLVGVRDTSGSTIYHEALGTAGFPVYRIRDLMIEQARASGASIRT